jgi:V/A-type H+-transporting ATPase subunit F
MKLFVLGHEDTVLGFSLIGVDGLATEDPMAAISKLDEIVAQGEVGLVLITAGLASRMRERVEDMERGPGLPLVLQVAAPGEPLEQPPIRDLVRKALGIKL